MDASSSNSMGDDAQHLWFEPLELHFHWFAMTDGQSTCESAKLPSYQARRCVSDECQSSPDATQGAGRPQCSNLSQLEPMRLEPGALSSFLLSIQSSLLKEVV